MLFKDLKVDDKFRRCLDPKATTYTKITPFTHAGQKRNSARLGQANGQPRMYYEFIADSDNVILVTS